MANFCTHGKKIVCIGRNYKDHAKELKNEVPSSPFFFLKPTSSYVLNDKPIQVPTGINVHHEVELGVVIGKGGKNIPASEAFNHVKGYAVGLDLTARDLQQRAKDKGLPWTTAKGFDTFCPIGDFIQKHHIKDPQKLELWLKIDGVDKQRGNTSDMIFKIPELIEHISAVMKLEEGDFILTGTPAGVGPILPGQIIEFGITGITTSKFMVTGVPVPKSLL